MTVYYYAQFYLQTTVNITINIQLKKVQKRRLYTCNRWVGERFYCIQYRGIELDCELWLFNMLSPLNNHNTDIQEKQENILRLIQTNDTKRLTVCIYKHDNYILK